MATGGQASRRYDYASMGFYTFDCLGRPVTDLPPGGDTFFIDELTLAVSGAAGSAAIAAAKYGLRCLAVGGVGRDLMGDWVLARLASFGVDTAAMQQLEGCRTSSSIVTTRPDGARPALHMKGATRDFVLTPDLVDLALDTRLLHLGGVGLMDRMDGAPSVALMREAKARGCITTVDIFASSPKDLPLVAGVLPFTDYFLPSIEEARLLSERESIQDCARFFLDLGAKACVLTLGGEGAYYEAADGTRFLMPAYDINVVCTCGCGDVFNAGFATGLLLGEDVEAAVRLGQATSALNAGGLGSQAGVVSLEHTRATMRGWLTRRAA